MLSVRMLPRYNYSSKESLHFRAKIPQAKASYYQNKVYLYDVSFPERQFSKTLLDMVLHSTPKGPTTHPGRAVKSSPLLCPHIAASIPELLTRPPLALIGSGIQGREQELKRRSFP